ncbi:MAG: RdgB/HAM1 family non-canonical purine NTP pyrophosphatase [Burkholderiales bacterium]|nr:RdgB/HAM1 family non-canonical purine NTP pyrophosphatase [Burkholderiales bacterium]
MRLVLASNNAKKLAELQALFSPLGLEFVNQGALGIPEAEEPHITFVENALLKARHAARHSGGPAISDDSGLCVDALGGAPGVASANFAPLEAVTLTHSPSPAGGGGEPISREGMRALQDAANNRLLLERLQGVEDRRARFVSTLVAVRSADDPEPLVAVGRWNGVILTVQRGEGGFGYDPLMFIPVLNQTVAELSAEVKNQRSHRAIAAQQMLALMREAWHLE